MPYIENAAVDSGSIEVYVDISTITGKRILGVHHPVLVDMTAIVGLTLGAFRFNTGYPAPSIGTTN